jgi:histone acetyltransferase (RNA polymerase elongator complex component)
MIIPFFIPHAGCTHQCVFCNQKNITGKKAAPDPSDIPSTIRSHLRAARSSGPAQVAYYGGSFTALPRETQKTYLEAVQPFIDAGEISCIRISTRPDAISADILELLIQHHVGIVELGAQSMDDGVLTRSGRGHSADDTVHAVRLLREHGFTIGLQLMPGLPGDSAGIFGDTVRRVIELRPDVVRIYPALVLKETPLEGLYRTGRYHPLSLAETVAWCRDAMLAFEKANVEVIRVGLQPTAELEKPGTIIAGPYHPAFRQLVDSSFFLDQMRTILRQRPHLMRSASLAVHPSDVSSAIGQKRHNIIVLQDEFDLAGLKIIPDDHMPRGTVRHQPSFV